MATIAKLVVGIDGDPTGLRRAFRQSADFVKKFQTEVGAANRASINNTANFLNRINKEFTNTASRLREDLFRGVINPTKAREEGLRAGREFNAGIIAEIDRLSATGKLTDPLRQSLVGRLKDVGFQAGDEIAAAMAARLKKAGAAIASTGKTLAIGVSLPLVLAGGFAFKEATRDESALVKMTNTFGQSAAKVTQSLKEIRQSVPAELDVLQDFTAGLGTMLQTMGIVPKKSEEMSVGIVKLAGDLAAFKQVPITDALEAIRAGMTGMTRGLKQFGVVIDESEIKNEALRIGLMKQGQELTQSGTALSFYSLLLQRSTLQQGSAAKMANLAGTQLAFAKVELFELASTIGGQLIPVLVPLLHQLSGLLRIIQELDPSTLGLIVKMAALAAAIGPVMILVGGLTKAVGFLFEAIVILRSGAGLAGLATLVSPGGIIVAGLLAVAAAVALVWYQMNRGKREVDAYKASLAAMSQAEVSGVAEKLAAQRRALIDERSRLMIASGIPKNAVNDAGILKNPVITDHIKGFKTVQNAIDAIDDKLGMVRERWAEINKGQELANEQAALFKKLLDQIGTATATNGAGNDPLGASKRLIAAGAQFEELRRTGPLAIRLGVELRNQYDALEKSLKALEKTDPFGEMANNIRDVLKSMRELSVIANTIDPKLPPPSFIPSRGRIPTPPPVAPNVPKTEISLTSIRLKQLADSAKVAGKGLLDGLGALGLRLLGMLNPLTMLTEAFAPLVQMVSTELAPIIQALADSLAPIVGALLKIIAPILRALIPLFAAMIPIFKALFPLIKLAAIGLTYFIQAIALSASIILRFAGNIIIVIGEIFLALAKAIDALPGIGAKGAIRTAQGVIDFGRALLHTSDEFKKTADGMADARKDIKAVTFDDTAKAVTDLGDAASTAAQQILNAVQGYKTEYLRYAAQDAINMSGSTTTESMTLTGDIYIDAKTLTRRELFAMVRAEAQAVALARFGDTARASEALT